MLFARATAALLLVSNLIPYLELPLPLRRSLFWAGLWAMQRAGSRAGLWQQIKHGIDGMMHTKCHSRPPDGQVVGPVVHLFMGIQVAHAHHDGDLVAVRQEVCSSS